MKISPVSGFQIRIWTHLWEKILRLKDSLSVFPKSMVSMYKRTHGARLWAGVFPSQTSESGSAEQNIHVISGPGELVYRPKNHTRSFNYRLSAASECSDQFKWRVGWNGRRPRVHGASTQSCWDRFMQRLPTFLSESCCLSHHSMQMGNLRDEAKFTLMSSDKISECFVLLW